MQIKSNVVFGQVSIGWEANVPDNWKMFTIPGNIEDVVEEDNIIVRPSNGVDMVEIYPLAAEYDDSLGVTRVWYQ